MAVSIPRAVIADAVGQKVTVETMAGEEYSGTLESVDTLMNIRLSVALVRSPVGEYSAQGNVTIAGSRLKLVRLPSVMRNAPFFKDVVSGAFTAAAKKKREAAAKAGKKRPPANS